MNPKPIHSTASRRVQFGFSLIELLVAVTIALFLLLVVSVVFISTKGAFTAQDQLSQLQDNERLSLTILTTSVQSAGYFPDPLVSTAIGDMPTTSGPYGNLAAGQGIVGTSGTSSASDTLTTRYVSASGDGLMDCQGQTYSTGSNTTIVNIYSVSANNELMCSVDGGTTMTALVSNVSALSIVYGTDSSASGNADRFIGASAVTAGSLWSQVRSARITVTFLNPFAGQSGQPATIVWVQSVNLMNKS